MSAHASHLLDLGFELRRQAEAARARARANPNDAFVQVEAHAFYTVVSLCSSRPTPSGVMTFSPPDAQRKRPGG
jgi:hypothetical protein